jgi:hypothetical protein
MCRNRLFEAGKASCTFDGVNLDQQLTVLLLQIAETIEIERCPHDVHILNAIPSISQGTKAPVPTQSVARSSTPDEEAFVQRLSQRCHTH